MLVDKLIAFWKLLKGKKSTLSSLMILIPAALTLMGQKEWAEWAQQVIDILFGESTMLAAIGIAGMGGIGIGLADKVRRREW